MKFYFVSCVRTWFSPRIESTGICQDGWWADTARNQIDSNMPRYISCLKAEIHDLILHLSKSILCIIDDHTIFATYYFTYMTFEKKNGVLLFWKIMTLSFQKFQPIRLRQMRGRENYAFLNEILEISLIKVVWVEMWE